MTSDINSFLETMVEAKAAIDAMPQLNARIAHLERQAHIHGETIANRELHIHNLKKSETELIQKLRSVEAERDDAGFRHLEEADKVSALLKHLRQFVTDSLKTISAVEGHALVVVEEGELSQARLDAEKWAGRAGDAERIANDRQDYIHGLEARLMTAELKAEGLKIALEEARLTHRLTTPLPDIAWDIQRPYNQPEPEVQREPAPTTVSALDPILSGGESDTTPTGQAIGSTIVPEGQSEPDPTLAGQSGPLPVSPETVEQSSSGTDQSQGSTTPMEAKPTSDFNEDSTWGWPIPSRASHNS